MTENKVIMTGGEIVDGKGVWAGRIDVSGMLIGGFANQHAGNVEKNTVEISGGTVNSWVIGGCSVAGDITNNTVTVSGGTVRDFVCGGVSHSGDATNNTVIISGGTVNNSVFGGYSEFGGTATNNTVILSRQGSVAPPVINGTLFGGNNYDNVSNNTLQVEAVGLSAPEIRNFDTYRFVLPSDIKAGDTMLTLTNQNKDVPIDSSRVSFATDSGFGLNLGESITLLHKTGGSKTLNLNGYGDAYERLDGVPDGQPVKEFWLYTSDEKDKLNARYDTGNTLTITSADRATAAFGGRAATGDVTGNEVEMTGGEIVKGNPIRIGSLNVSGMLIGGFADAGNVEKNTVEISGGTVMFLADVPILVQLQRTQ